VSTLAQQFDDRGLDRGIVVQTDTYGQQLNGKLCEKLLHTFVANIAIKREVNITQVSTVPYN